jgi:hypothetical protein
VLDTRAADGRGLTLDLPVLLGAHGLGVTSAWTGELGIDFTIWIARHLGWTVHMSGGTGYYPNGGGFWPYVSGQTFNHWSPILHIVTGPAF